MLTEIDLFPRAALSLILACLASFAAVPPTVRFARKVGAIDIPRDNRRMHKIPIPRMGGLAIFLGFLLSVLLFAELEDRSVRATLYGAGIILILGMLDDKYSLGPYLKLAVQIAAASVAVFWGDNRVMRLTNPFGGGEYSCIDLGVLSGPLTILWIVAITNAVNFIDGLDGLACGVCSISSASLMVIAMILVSREDAAATAAVAMAAMTGACLGFLPYNKNPAKIFMGDTGSTFLGFVLACVSVQGLFKFHALISFAVPVLLLGLPIIDICFAVIRRIAHGQNPMKADRSHIHHRLIDMGYSQKQTVTFAWVLTALLGLDAILLTVLKELRTLILAAGLILVGGATLFLYLHDRRRKTTGGSSRDRETGRNRDEDL